MPRMWDYINKTIKRSIKIMFKVESEHEQLVKKINKMLNHDEMLHDRLQQCLNRIFQLETLLEIYKKTDEKGITRTYSKVIERIK